MYLCQVSASPQMTAQDLSLYRCIICIYRYIICDMIYICVRCLHRRRWRRRTSLSIDILYVHIDILHVIWYLFVSGVWIAADDGAGPLSWHAGRARGQLHPPPFRPFQPQVQPVRLLPPPRGADIYICIYICICICYVSCIQYAAIEHIMFDLAWYRISDCQRSGPQAGSLEVPTRDQD